MAELVTEELSDSALSRLGIHEYSDEVDADEATEVHNERPFIDHRVWDSITYRWVLIDEERDGVTVPAVPQEASDVVTRAYIDNASIGPIYLGPAVSPVDVVLGPIPLDESIINTQIEPLILAATQPLLDKIAELEATVIRLENDVIVLQYPPEPEAEEESEHILDYRPNSYF